MGAVRQNRQVLRNSKAHRCCYGESRAFAEELKGKVVWVSGASSGIGECLAYDLARAGCKLVLSSRKVIELERVKKNCIGLYDSD